MAGSSMPALTPDGIGHIVAQGVLGHQAAGQVVVVPGVVADVAGGDC